VPIHYEVKGRIAHIVIDGRGDYNIFNPDVVYEPLKATMEKFRDDPDVWVGVVSVPPEKKVFTYGGDVKSVSAIRNRTQGEDNPARGYAPAGKQRIFRHDHGDHAWSPYLLRVGEMELFKPLVFAVQGSCIGAGMLLLAAKADYAVVTPDVRFGMLELKHAIGGGGGLAQQLLSQLPWRIAMDMILRARFMYAEEALRLGFVNEIAPKEELLDAAFRIAEDYAAMPPLHVQAVKRMALYSRDLPASAMAFPGMLMSALMQDTPDSKEGPKAFAEKRKANYTGKME
jgi:enoyl-CoA hydratase/carnithine racemase